MTGLHDIESKFPLFLLLIKEVFTKKTKNPVNTIAVNLARAYECGRRA